uniref:Nicotinamide nucleotide adenylyltransferase 1 n=1 Tax=Cyprinus carpio carpio TaxID=630221 RepID=A0A8C1CRG2_CYPCA
TNLYYYYYYLVKGIISPAGDNYKKKGLIEACHRLEMARLATENSDWISVDDWESQHPEWVETANVVRWQHLKIIENNNDDVDTVRFGKRRKLQQNKNICQSSSYIKTKADTPHLNLLCGADLLESFGVPNLWKPEGIEEIVGRYGETCITRCGGDPEKFINQSDILYKHRKSEGRSISNHCVLIIRLLCDDILISQHRLITCSLVVFAIKNMATTAR